MRERELTIKGQEILTSDKVAVRVSIMTQFRVVDPVAAMEKVETYEDRLYSDVQLAARRSLASMTLEAILTNRNRLSEDILRRPAERGRRLRRGDPAGRREGHRLPRQPAGHHEPRARGRAAQRGPAGRGAHEGREGDARGADQGRDRPHRREAGPTRSARPPGPRWSGWRPRPRRRRSASGPRRRVEALRLRSRERHAYAQHPALLRLQELESLATLSRNAQARIYIGFDKHAADPAD